MKDLCPGSKEQLPKMNLEMLDIQNPKEPLSIPPYMNYLEKIKTKWSESPQRYHQLIKTYFHVYKLMKDTKRVHFNKLKVFQSLL